MEKKLINFKTNKFFIFIDEKYKSIFQKNRSYCKEIFLSLWITVFSQTLYASGAYDKGTATGKNRFELSLTYNPIGLVPYGQNYAVLSYGISKNTDIVTYYSKHQNGTRSQYIGGLYQFFKSDRVDLATAIGIRNTNSKKNDIFFPQILYNYKLPSQLSLGGSIVKVLELDSQKDLGNAIDISLYFPMKRVESINDKIEEAFFSVGVFKNTQSNVFKDELYFHYSVDIIFSI